MIVPQTRRYSFIIRDWTAYRARVAEREAVAAANELLGMMGAYHTWTRPVWQRAVPGC